MPHHCATPRNLHVLVVIEEGRQVHTGAYATHPAMIQAWRDWVVSIATEETALDDELRVLGGMEGSTMDIADLLNVAVSDIDLIAWWLGRDELNEARFYEVQDRRNTP